jgi:redox-sensitive bicupin YhaK (pirin superfamily)
MILVRESDQRGYAHHNWLESYHTFSFANYYDPEYMGFEKLRVINEDFIEPGMGFATHRHHDMEILTYVIEGVLEHKDSMGTGSQIRPGEVQIMSAGSGIAHSEFNASLSDKLHLLQIWILPDKTGLTPRYEQKTIVHSPNEMILIAAPEENPHAVKIHQNMTIKVAYLTKDFFLRYTLTGGHAAWLQVVEGKVELNSISVSAGDGAAIEDESALTLLATENAEILLFEFKG